MRRQRRRDRGGEAETERELGAKRTKEKRGKRREKMFAWIGCVWSGFVLGPDFFLSWLHDP